MTRTKGLRGAAWAVFAIALIAAVSVSIAGAWASNSKASAPNPLQQLAMNWKSHQVKHTRIDLNSASPEALSKLPGIDRTTAEKIIAARPFKKTSDLVSEKLVSSKEYAKIRSQITVRHETAMK